MTHQWKAGDLARCIEPSASILRYKGIYRVKMVTPPCVWDSGFEGVGLVLHGQRHPTNRDGDFVAHRFRPILPAEPAFTTAMRALKPIFAVAPSDATGGRPVVSLPCGSSPATLSVPACTPDSASRGARPSLASAGADVSTSHEDA